MIRHVLLSKEIFHIIWNIQTIYMHVYVFRHGFLRLYYVEDWPRFVKFLCAHERADTNIGQFFFSETNHVRKPGLQTFRILNSHDPMESQGCFEIL